jgi:2-(1,2-epoxy-1,2-dihydrophenyl)acetyl-CoA isomerase
METQTNFHTLLFAVRGEVAHLTLNRPEAANAINVELARELEEAALICDQDPAIRAILLTGAGRIFCGGGDLRSFAAADPAALPGLLKRLTFHLHRAIYLFARMDAPLVIAVNGNTGGAGMSLAAAGDIVIAGESSRFTLAYTRVGLSPDGSSTYFLPRLIGLRRTLELALTNRTISAREAEAWGIVTRVVADAEVAAQAESIAAELANGPTRSYGAVKRLLYACANTTLDEQMELETETIANVARSEDSQEGIRAFLAKRAPVFKGR